MGAGAILPLTAGFFFLFLAFSAAQGLSTTLSGDLGSVCLGVLYATFALVCIPAPKLVRSSFLMLRVRFVTPIRSRRHSFYMCVGLFAAGHVPWPAAVHGSRYVSFAVERTEHVLLICISSIYLSVSIAIML